RVWPPETADDYAGQTGYWAACAARGLAFALVFVPLTAAVSAPYSLGGQIREAVTAPARLWRRRTVPTEESAKSPPRLPAPEAPAAVKRAIDDGARRVAAPSELSQDRPRFLTR